MTERTSDFRATLLELIDMSPEPLDHPAPDQWLAYQRSELPPEEEARLQEHLVRCRDCFDLSRAAADFAPPDGEPDGEMETAALWRLLRPQLEPAAGGVRKVHPISEGRRRSPWRERALTALAASLFVAVAGLTVWNLQQQSALETLRAPKPDALIYDFSAGERLPSAAEETLAAGTGPWTLVFHPGEELPVYRLTLREAESGRDLWSYELRPDQDLALTLQLPEGLRPGRYLLEVSAGTAGRQGRVLETHRLRVTEPEPGG